MIAGPGTPPPRRVMLVMLVMLVVPGIAVAQDGQSGRIVNPAAGQLGPRQERDQVVAGIKPMSRISNRIPNRVQSRIRNRIDRDYDPQANAASPFVVAAEQVRATARAIRR